MRVLVINGPNLNLLGHREPQVYGRRDLEEISRLVEQRAQELGVEVEFYQSNHEGALVDVVQQARDRVQGIVINPAAYTHYGLALREALAAVEIPAVEVHLTNIMARESWRERSVIAPVVQGQVSGLGAWGYVLALEALFRLNEDQRMEGSRCP